MQQEQKLVVLNFSEIGINDGSLVGGKNASLAQMYNNLREDGIRVPDGFAVSSIAYWDFFYQNNLLGPLKQLMETLDREDFNNLEDVSAAAKRMILEAEIPDNITSEVSMAYYSLCEREKRHIEVAVRSSATAEDLPSASFAGLHDSFLNIRGSQNLVEALHKCYASLFNARAIKYRIDKGFSLTGIAVSVGVQVMVRSDRACSGVAFTLDPESGFKDVVVIDGSWGLGENIVKGVVSPDEFYLFKPSLKNNHYPLVSKKLGSKNLTMVYAENIAPDSESTVVNIETPVEKQHRFVLSDEEIMQLARWCIIIEGHYRTPMDIEWAKDGISGQMYIVQARPETVNVSRAAVRRQYVLGKKGKLLAEGSAIGERIVSGPVRIVSSVQEAEKIQKGDILVTEITNPDWDTVMKKAAAIVTNKGGRTSHAAIVARELDIPAVVGTGNITAVVSDGEVVTVSCAEGRRGFVYDGALEWIEHDIDLGTIEMPAVKPMFILSNPEQAFKLSFYPNEGVGLLRIEFIITNTIRIHPMALVHYHDLQDKTIKYEIDTLTRGYERKTDFFVGKLAQAVATIACAFYPKDVIVRMSDFKSNEYASLIGGKQFEPLEENPMLGLRGASRYYHPAYRQAFLLECAAMKKVRDDMGLHNVKLMIPFCRTVEEGRKVIKLMEQYGLKKGDNGLEIYVMAEIPSNVILAGQFAQVFDGFSIGSNDLTQLTLGIDRDSSQVSGLFDEMNEAVLTMVANVIEEAKRNGKKVGLCGQAPSDLPGYAEFLVSKGIHSISFTPDAMLKGIGNINKAESALRAVQSS